MVNTALIEDSPMSIAALLEEPPTEQVKLGPEAAERQRDENVAAQDDASAPPARRIRWSMPTAEQTRKRTDELGRIATRFGALFGRFARSVAEVCGGIAAFVGQVISVVPPGLRLLGGLGLCLILSIIGSVALDNVLGKSCAVVFVPGFALAFGVVATRWYSGLGNDHDHRRRSGVGNAVAPAPDLERSVEYVDAKLAFALSAFGTDRHQQAVVALIQAKTATELSFSPARPESGGHGPRPRISDGGAPKTSGRESASAPGHS